MCNHSRYFIPIFLKSEIGRTSPDKITLTPDQDQLLMTMLTRNGTTPRKLAAHQPFIIGSFTNWRLLRMKKAIELLLKLDPNRLHALNEAEFNELKLQ